MNRRISIPGLLPLLASLFGSSLLLGQVPATTDGAQTVEPANPQLKPHPLAALRKFEQSARGEYQLGRGDEVHVDFAVVDGAL